MPTRQRKPSNVVATRLKRCRQAMAKQNLPALLVTSRVDHIYLTGFTGEDSAVLITPRVVHVISDGRFETSIQKETPWAAVSLRRGQLVDEIATVVRSYRLKRLAVQAENMTLATRAALAGKLKGVRLLEEPGLIANMRSAKDDGEVKIIEEAVALAEAAYTAMLKTIRVGQTELELAARLEYEMKRRGSSTPAFDSIVAIDANAALPHAFAGQRKVRRGCCILFDWGATCGFYRSDLTRTVFIGSIPPRLGRIYELVLEAQERAIAAIRPGARMCDVDAVARNYIADAGFGPQFGHGLGHGLGLDVHEAPSLSWRSDAKLQAGMVVTVEPGIYLPGVGGVRIEDDVLVTRQGGRLLSRLRKSLATAVLSV